MIMKTKTQIEAIINEMVIKIKKGKVLHAE